MTSLRLTMPQSLAPNKQAASTRPRRVLPTCNVIINTRWKNESMKNSDRICVSPMPAHKTSSGMNADAGR